MLAIMMMIVACRQRRVSGRHLTIIMMEISIRMIVAGGEMRSRTGVGQGRHLGKSLRRHIPGDRTTSTAELKLNLCENSIKCQYSSYTRQKNHTRQKTQNHTFLVTTDHTNHTTLKPDVCQNGI